jgi:hypothetical protein
MTRNIPSLISDAEWLDYVLDFIFSVMAAADENRPTLYSSRIDGYLMPFNGRVS